MRSYGVIHTAFWTSPTIRQLSDDGKLLAAYLLSCPHTNLIGLFRAPDGYVSEDLNWGFERVSKGFRNLSDKGFATRDEQTKWVVIHRFLEFNPIENPNQAKAAIKVWSGVPDAVPFKPYIAWVLKESVCRFKDKIKYEFGTLSKPFRNPSETLSKPGTGTETEDQETKETSGIFPSPVDNFSSPVPPEPDPGPDPGAVPEPDPEPDLGARPRSATERQPEPEPEPGHDPVPEPAPGPDPDSGARPKPRTFTFSEDHMAMATAMFEAIRQVAPHSRQPNFEAWANTIRLMFERDGLSLEEIEQVFSWANRHGFWKTNILSPDKLREQFPKLHAQMTNQTPGGGHDIDFDEPFTAEEIAYAASLRQA